MASAVTERAKVVTVWQPTVGEHPEVTFAALRDYYLCDSSVKASVDNLVAQTIGSGFYVTADTAKALSVVEEFNEDAAVDEWLQQVCTEILYAGNSFTEKPKSWASPPELTSLLVELSSIIKIRRTETGQVVDIIQRIGGAETPLSSKDILHFAWNPVDRSAFGVGMLSPLANTRVDSCGDTVPALLDIKAQIENDMRRLIHKYPPRFLIQFDVSDEKFERIIKPQIQGSKPGEDFATNAKVDFKELSVSSQGRFDYMLEWLLNQTYLGLETPLPRLLTTTGFTEASANAALEIAEAFRVMLQRFLKRRYERLVVKPLLEARGVDPGRSGVKLHWGTPDSPELTFEALSEAFKLGGIRPDEYRKNLQKFGFEIWEPQTPATTSTMEEKE